MLFIHGSNFEQFDASQMLQFNFFTFSLKDLKNIISPWLSSTDQYHLFITNLLYKHESIKQIFEKCILFTEKSIN